MTTNREPSPEVLSLVDQLADEMCDRGYGNFDDRTYQYVKALMYKAWAAGYAAGLRECRSDVA